ncbi:MAG TPA: ABC-type transport auxiliary lipoprotein family protein [Kofleriaceae bacterium]|nr:ABC-type transport auxiliary lipoprotein family protein [Kofleriaceae bacterium]
MRLAIAIALVGCAAAVPETHYYQLSLPVAAAASPNATATITIAALDAQGPYDDDRMVYRQDPYRLDYYPYRRWSSPPGTLIADYLADAFSRSGRFRAVLRDAGAPATLALGGRVLAIEEVDQSRARSTAHVALQLDATDPATGKLVWSARYDDREPMSAESADGLARALSSAMARIAQRAEGDVARVAVTVTHGDRVGAR